MITMNTPGKEKAGVTAAVNDAQRLQDRLVQSEKLAALGTLCAGVVHELNNPLTGILGIAREMRKHRRPGDRELGDLDQIVYAGERMADIIRGLLVFSRTSTREMEVLDCREVIATVLRFSQRIMRGRDVVVQQEFAPDLPGVMAENNRLQQVVFNILHNAFDAMQDRGTLKLATRCFVTDQGRYVEMEFTDSGHGITKEDLPRVFDPFFTTKRSDKGTGLGLAVTYSIVREYGGDIVIESPPAGQSAGASFKVRLPAVGALTD